MIAPQQPNLNLSFFKSVTDKQPKTVDTQWLFLAIKEPWPKTKEACIRIREFMAEHAKNGTVKQGKKELEKLGWKKGLPAVTVSGIFEDGHQAANLKELNGLMQVDFDEVHNLDGLISLLRNDPYTHLEFLSPSGLGVKVIVKYTGHHLAAFEGLRNYYEQTYCVKDTFATEMDKVCKDVSRLCFLSYDPDAYYNENSQVFVASNEAPEEPKVPVATPVAVQPKPTPKMPTKGGEKLGTAADVEKVIAQLKQSHFDITGGYETWRDIGFALASEFGESGRAYFHEVSQYSPKYEPNFADEQYTAFCKGTGTGAKKTIKAFFGIAKANGFDIKPVYSNSNNEPKNGVKKAASIPAVIPSQSQPEPPEKPQGESQPVDVVDLLERRIEDTENGREKEHSAQHGFYIKNSAYWNIEVIKGKQFDNIVSNFVMDILYHFKDDSNSTKRLIKLQRDNGDISVVEVNDSESSPDKFQVVLMSRGCTFYGSSYTLKRIFLHGMNKELTANTVGTLGYQPDLDIYVMANCAIQNGKIMYCNEIGVVTLENRVIYIPAGSQFTKGDSKYVNERQFMCIEGSVNFETWSKAFYEAYDINGAIGLCFLIQCVLSDVFFDEMGFFPFLFLFGPPGVGKSTYVELLLRLFGGKNEGLSLKSNFKAIARAASQRRNALLFLNEYDNNMSNELELMFKSFYNRKSYTVAQTSNDNRTKSHPVYSGVVFDGNSLPTKSTPFFDRHIVLNFEQSRFTRENTNAYNRLKQFNEEGLGQVLAEILAQREYYKERIKGAFTFAFNELKGWRAEFDGRVIEEGEFIFNGVNISKFPDRTLNHIAFICSTVLALKDKFAFPFAYEDLARKVVMDAIEKNEMMAEINDIALFWDSLTYTQKIEGHRVVPGKHYMIEPLEQFVYIKMKEVYPVYIDYCKKLSLIYADMHSLVSLLTSSSYKPFVPSGQKGRKAAIVKSGFGSCYRFRFEEPRLGEKGFIIGGKEVVLI